ncbi:hypothetical protein [Actinomadura sp. BRA 177]|uniref:hypothetical protein n=1 Tax=Actinomadura sp. BRA 177 TaxID=2745202 RepID=UPI001595110D|nr:hypothetical protein [Actinomadura sp. BRA 177]NVI91846.1 hypothetical protein [Actinomadura sp. BRA 177]
MPEELARRLGQGSGPVVERCACAWNDVLLPVLPTVLFVASVGGTIGLQPDVLLVWAMFALFVAYLYARWRDQLIVEAHLAGTVLTVQRRGRVSSCDLAAVGRVRLGSNITARGDKGFYALSVRDAQTGKRVRYVLRTDDCRPLSGADLCLLAGALEATPPSARSHSAAHNTAARLRRIARDGYEKSSSEIVDWSHRIRNGD